MCRMLIAIGNVDVNSLIDGAILMAKDQNNLHELNEKQGKGSWVHKDGWGVAYLNQNNQWVVKKSTKPIFDDPEIEELRKIKTNILMIHSRYKMGSGVSIKNTHPFVFSQKKQGTFVFCHNGFIDEEIYYDKKFQAEGDTDSERLFYSILTDLKTDNTVKAVRKNFKRYKKLTGTNIVLCDGENTVVAMRKNKFPKYYQMSVGRTEDMVLVSSEKFNTKLDIFWEPLEQGDIVKINHQTLKIKNNKEKGFIADKISSLYSHVSRSIKKNKGYLENYLPKKYFKDVTNGN